jgi:hypothetical protein
MSAAALGRAPWYADSLRWLGSAILTAAERLEQRALETADEPWPDLLPPHERVFELRNRIHNGYY